MIPWFIFHKTRTHSQKLRKEKREIELKEN